MTRNLGTRPGRFLLLRRAVAVMALLLAAGCAGSPPVAYYTLVSSAPATPNAAGAADEALVEVVPVTVPAQVDQPQMMLRDSSGVVSPLYSQRWTAPLGDEVRAAVADRLTRELGIMDVNAVKPARGQPVWRVQIDVQRFDSIDGEAAVLDATWRLRGINMRAPGALCRTQVRVPVDAPGTVALVRAHQTAMHILSRRIADRISGQQSVAMDGVTDICRAIAVDQDA